MYRSYGLLLLMVAVLIASQGYRDQITKGLFIGGLILCIDLPLRLLGQIVPWREDDVVYWYISRYRGSHIFFIPTWLVGALWLCLAGACLFSPDFANRLQTSSKDRDKNVPANKDAKPPEPAPPPLPKGTLEIQIEETKPFNGTAFRYTVTNKTEGVVSNISEYWQYRSADGKITQDEQRRANMAPGEVRAHDIRVIGPSAVYVLVNIGCTSPELKALMVERDWKREKK